MPILKTIKKEKDFVQINNSLAQNENMTYEAKGMLVELLSRAKNWVVRKEQLKRTHTKEAKVTRIVKEIQSKGHMRIIQIRDDSNQRIKDRVWVVSEEPKTEKEWASVLENLRLRESSTGTLENLRLRESSSINTENNINTESINKEKRNALSPILSSLSLKNQKIVEDIFLYWNLHKGEKGWHSHTKITYDIREAILENTKKYSMEEVCYAIDNYAKVLTGEEYFWEHTWPLSTFLTVKEQRKEGSPKKWWKFHPENFIEDNYRKDYKKENILRQETPLVNVYSYLVDEIICNYKELISSPKFESTPVHMQKFIQASYKLTDFWAGNRMGADDSVCIAYLMECMDQTYVNKGNNVFPGHLCSDHTWDVLMPQHLKGLGVWYREKERV